MSISCSTDFDARRRAPPPSTLGDDVYSALCDRVGAATLTEDLGGRSYRALCHRDAAGRYAASVDARPEVLPPVSGGAAVARRLAIAKLEAMARRREDLVRAFDAIFSDAPVPVPHSGGKTIAGREALSALMKSLVPLYERNPVKGALDPDRGLVPDLTRSLGRMFAGLSGPAPGTRDDALAQTSKAAREAMAHIAGRQGYRPQRVALGAVRPALAYPGLRGMAQVLLPRLEPGGSMHAALQNVFGMLESELASSSAQPPPVLYQVEPIRLQPNRTRSKIEITRSLMLEADGAFAAPGSEPRFLARRDPRGVVLPLGAVPGQSGDLGPWFVDADGDGLADADAHGRLLGADGAIARVDPPFVVPLAPRLVPPDPFGRALDPDGRFVYEYVDTSQTLVASLLRDLEPLLEPDPTLESETIADLLSGAYRLYGDPVQREAPWAVGGAFASFDASTSPIADLLHATGQMLANPNSDTWLSAFSKLLRDEPRAVARFMGATLRLREISNARPDVRLDPKVTFWDELVDVLVEILREDPALFKDMLRSFAHPDAVAYLPGALRLYAQHRDLLTYDSNDLGGPPVNLTLGGAKADPSTAVDRMAPDVGDNRSELHRILQIVHDVNGLSACNREGARVSVVVNFPILPPLDLLWPAPPLPGYGECELFVFENVGLVFVDAILGKAQIQIRDGLLDGLVNGPLGGLVDTGQLFEESSGIPGMTLSPTPQGFARLALFGARSSKFDALFNGQMPDRDVHFGGNNAKTDRFVSNLVDPLSTTVCPTRPPLGSPGTPPGLQLADCSLPTGNPFDLLRLRDRGVLFTWEKYQFYDGFLPLLTALDAHDATQLFLDLSEVIYRHYPTSQPSRPDTECSAQGTFKKTLDGTNPLPRCPGGNPCFNPRYCAGSGVSAYEPILVEALATDLFPALAELVQALERTTVTDRRQATPVTKSGLDVAYELAVALFDPQYAAAVGMRDRAGNAGTTLADEVTPKPQLTPFDLYANALRAIDRRLEGDPRRDRWRRARSRLVDTFLAVDGEGTGARFRNPATPQAGPLLIDALREQLNAHCPDREQGVPCEWARRDLAANAALTFEEPAFSTTMVLLDLINEDDAARRELQSFLKYLVHGASDHDALHSTLTSLSDLLQLLGDDSVMPPIYNAVSVAAAPERSRRDGLPTSGAGDRTVQFLRALTDEPVVGGTPTRNAYDPYRLLDRLLSRLVAPLDPANPASTTPLEVLLDTIAEVNRVDASAAQHAPLDAEDYRFVFGTVRDFLTSDTRGLEQFYEIVNNRRGD